MDIQKEREAFQPQMGEKYWHVSPEKECGYASSFWSDAPVDRFVSQFGICRTKSEIKLIVTQIRKIANLAPDGLVLVPVASISTFYQDDDEPENFANLDDGVSVLGDCCDLDDIVVINKIEQASISTTKMWGAFKVVDGTSNFTLFNNELDAIAARDETVGHYMEVHA